MVAAFAILACAPLAPTPELLAVEPSRGWTGEGTAVLLEGEHLLPALDVGGLDPVDAEFEGWILASTDVRLEGLHLVDYTTLGATVPPGIEPGVYDIRVLTPTGGEATLTSAFRVTLTRADHLALTTGSAAYDLGEWATLSVALLDPEGLGVAEAASVEIVATSSTGAEGVTLDAGTLADVVVLDDSVGLRGDLAADGTATFLAASTIPDDVNFTVRAVNDDGIDPSAQLLSWDRGGLADLVISLPFDPYRAVAGEPFTARVDLRDSFGNPLPDTYARVLVTDDCNDLRQVVDVVGSAEVEITLTTACPVNHLYAFNAAVESQSEAFEVIAGELAAYEVLATPTAVTAGSDPLLILVTAIDAHGNPVPEHQGTFTLADNLGGLDSSRTACPSFNNGEALCVTYLLAAGSAVVTATDDAGVTGQSEAVTVSVDEPSALSVEPVSTSAVAGTGFAVHVTLTDAWGNAIEIDPSGADAVGFVDDTGTIACGWTGPVGAGRQAFSCTVTVATSSDLIVASLDSYGLSGEATERVTVDNGALALVTVSTPASTVAGESFVLSLIGFDAYGNGYVVQSDPVVDLDDSTGTIDVGSARLDATGAVSVPAVITGATASAEVVVSQGGVELGRGSGIEVFAAEMSAFAVVAPPWITLDDEVVIDTWAVDAYGNIVEDYTGTAALTTGADCTGATLTDWQFGLATSTTTCTDVSPGARFDVVDTGGNSGQSGLVDVVDTACGGGPSAVLTVDGDTEPVRCLAAGEVTLDLDGSGSTGSPVLFQFVDSDGNRDRGPADLVSRTWTGAGPRVVRMLAARADGCAAETETTAWLGNDDGEPAGPVSVAAGASTVATGAATTVSVSATDCNGDVAAGQALWVRADLGATSATTTGSGSTLTLDGSGASSLTWAFPTGYAGTATLHVGSASAGGYGSTSLSVTGDSARPRVVSVSPAGTTTGTVSAISVEFDEDLLSTAITDVVLTGPSGAVTTTQSLSSSTLTVTPATAVDASLGEWTLTLGTGIRDTSGNRLAGAWTSAASSFTSRFGNVPSTLPTLGGCDVDTDTFRPDGDDGAGEEADEVTITPVSSAAPAWWWLVVSDALGDRVRSDRVLGTVGSISWNGRADDGIVVSAGDYIVTVYAIDDYANTSSACTDLVQVEHRLELP